MIEATAMLAARVHQRLDDDFGEIATGLLSILYPHYLAPVPSSMIVQFETDPETPLPPGGLRVPRHTVLRTLPVEHVVCRFRTAYPVTLLPLEIRSLELVPSNALGVPVPADVRSALRISLRTRANAPLAGLGLSTLRFYLPGEGAMVSPLYELLLRDPRGVVLRSGGTGGAGRSVSLDASCVRPLGFGRDEGLLEYPAESFVGYRLLQEYFAFQEKFLFVEFAGLDRLPAPEKATDLEICVLLAASVADLDLRLSASDLQLGCTPVVNLFRQVAEPIRLTHTRSEYAVQPDARTPRYYEVYSIQKVFASRLGTTQAREFLPFFALRHTSGPESGAFWHATRSETIRKDYAGSDVALTLVDPEFDPRRPSNDTVTVETLCTNRDLPSRLEFGRREGEIQVEGRPEIKRVRCLRNPTPSLRSPVAEGSRWRIVSHLSLNYLSLSEEGGSADGRSAGGLEALRELLKLYDLTDSPVARARINGLVGLRTRKVVRPLRARGNPGFARGLEVEIELDPAQFTGGGLFLFASVLERFMALYTSTNSFTQTLARIRGREEILKRWPPRAGEIPLI
jgi:type VI secretion system protein ImpG